MPKQEYKILEFHGGTNNLFDPRDIAENQNAFSQMSIGNPGRLTLEGGALSLYSKTSINPLTVTDVGAAGTQSAPQSFVGGYGLFTFSHDYNMEYADIVQNGTDFASNWIARDAGGVEDGWAINDSSSGLAAYEDDETASLINTLGGEKLDAGKTYRLSFDVGVATLSLAIGGGDLTGNTSDETYIPATNYIVGSHSVVFTSSADRTHLWFTSTTASGGNGTLDNVSCYKVPDETDTNFIVSNDKSNINIYDPSNTTPGWAVKSTLGSRLGTVKPNYYNVDGALRVCDANFDRVDTNFDTAANITLNDTSLTIDDGNGGNVTLASGSLIEIDNEIMYVETGVANGTSVPSVIRGYANTKIKQHQDNTGIYYVNVPKYLGHIKRDRLFEAATSNPVNMWIEDVQTPQPPNNYRKGGGVDGSLALGGEQSLRIYSINSDSTSNYPTQSEKVVMEFVDDWPSIGIKKVSAGSSDRLTLTISGDGDDPNAGHGYTIGDEVIISNVDSRAVDSASAVPAIDGEHEIVAVTKTTFTIEVENTSFLGVDWDDGNKSEDAASGDLAAHTLPNTVIVTLENDETPSAAGTKFWVHLTGNTGTLSVNGVKEATAIDADTFYFEDSSTFSAGGTTKVQQLIAVVAKKGEDAISQDLKKKFNFAMSFTYDGPGQEVQESLLNQGYKITAMTRTDGGGANTINEALSDSDTTITVDDKDDFAAGDVILVGSEQIYVGGTGGSEDLTSCVRGYNGSTAAAHSDGDQIYKVEELTPTATIDWTTQEASPKVSIKFLYNHGVSGTSWNPRINGFKIYMKDVSSEDSTKDWFLFSRVNLDKGTYQILAADEQELILEQPGTWASDGKLCTLSTGTVCSSMPIDTYLSENLFTPETIIDAQYRCCETVGRKTYVGNIRQGGRTYPDRMLVTPSNKFDTFPETNFIDVAIGDGDAITALKSFGDRLLQFKRNSIYVINTSGDVEVLETEYNNNGVHFPSQVIKTSNGIAWVNEAGLWLFDGQKAENLTLFLEDGGYTLGTTNLNCPKIGYDKISNRLIYSPKIGLGVGTAWYIFNLELKAYQAYYTSIMPYSESNANYLTNIINDAEGNMIFGYVDDATNTELNFFKWDNEDKGHYSSGLSNFYKTRDIDLGSPGVRKKIYKVYVTYKCTGHSGVKMKYATNGSTTFTDFDSSSSTNYDVSSFSGAGTATGFQNSSGAWAIAELKPSSSINNVYSFQLSLDAQTADSGTATGGSSTSIILQAGGSPTTSTTDDAYNNYNIYIYSGAGRFNSKLITDYEGDGAGGTQYQADFTSLTDRGYGNAAASGSKYMLGSPAPDFEINDITVIFRAKPIK